MEIRKANLLNTARRLVCIAALLSLPLPVVAASSDEHRERRPDLFNAESGLRADRYRAPVPDDVPGAKRVSAKQVREMAAKGALLIDVFGAPQSRYDELNGTWLVSEPRLSLPGAVWLPEVGRGSDVEAIQTYFQRNLDRLTGGDKARPIIIFCVADCWMSWNAVQRVRGFGYTNVSWFAEGTDGWLDQGWTLEPVLPVPVEIE